jgi:hypothetical protein
VASVEQTAYPRFKKVLAGRELNEFYTPSEEEAMFGRSTVRGDVNLLSLFCSSSQDLSAVLLLPAATRNAHIGGQSHSWLPRFTSLN